MADEFKVHRLNAQGLEKAEAVARGFELLLAGLDELGVTGRERALVVTKLQEAAFYAKRSIAVLIENQVDPTWQTIP